MILFLILGVCLVRKKYLEHYTETSHKMFNALCAFGNIPSAAETTIGHQTGVHLVAIGNHRWPLVPIVTIYTQDPNVIPQNYFPIDFNAFPCLQETEYCEISRWNYNSFVMVIKQNNRCTRCATYMNFWLPTFQIQQLKLWRNFENSTFPLMLMGTSPKHCPENLVKCWIVCSSSLAQV